jgi:choline dehydrogenase-like flavoprotein
MHADPALGVVNADCRMHELENVHIAGASVFPTAGFANPALTIIALALRLADHLDLRR